MLRPVIKIVVTQQPSTAYPKRTVELNMDFVTSYEVDCSWDQLTDTAKLVLPKSVIAIDGNGQQYSLYGDKKSIGGGRGNILFLRGDKVTISAGYKYKDAAGNEQTYIRTLFKGFITKVHSKIPIELECENNAWLLKQTPMRDRFWPKDTTLDEVLTEALGKVNSLYGSKLSVPQDLLSKQQKQYLGTFVTKGETVSQMLARVMKDYNLQCFLDGDDVLIGDRIYGFDNKDARNTNADSSAYFVFQQNIISDALEYKRTDDLILSVAATSISTSKPGPKTKDGKEKTKNDRLEILVYMDPSTRSIKYLKKDKKTTLPDSDQGERYTYYDHSGITDPEVLFQKVKTFLQGYYCTGLEGSFTTFGLPFVKVGYNVNLIDSQNPDRNGQYKVKKVVYKFGITTGIRQEVYLDYKVKDAPYPNNTQTLL